MDYKKRKLAARNAFIKSAKAYVAKLGKKIGKVSAILYGSVAKGNFSRGSDVDILIVSDSLPQNILKRLDLLFSSAPPGFEPKGYKGGEFKKFKKKPIYALLAEDAVVLVDQLAVF